MKPKFVLSLCGTSLLTNGATEEERLLVNAHANVKNERGVGNGDRKTLQDLIDRRESELLGADARQATGMSAELNALFKLYEGQLDKARNDQHWLLCTDTWLGRQTGELIKKRLEQDGISSVQIPQLEDLQTKELYTFQNALSDLVKWCAENVEPCRESHHIVFNLTGGFKSIQGFLQTLAMFYADEAIYVFESGEELLRIPKLPIRLDAEDEVRRHLRVFRRLARDLPPQGPTDGIPETLLFRVDNDISLSPWGGLVWQQTHKEMYCKKLWPSPSEKIIYGGSFAENVRSLSPDRVEQVNTKLDLLADHLEHGDRNLNSLDLKRLKGPAINNCTHELDAWGDQDAKRMYGRLESGVFTIERLDKALH